MNNRAEQPQRQEQQEQRQQQRPDLQLVEQPPAISPKRALFNALEKARPEFGRVLPRHLSADRFLQVAFMTIKNNPVLTECTAESVVGALMEAAQHGLEPDTMGTCYILPYNKKVKVNGRDQWIKEAQFQLGYKGMIELVRRSGQVTNIVANEVYQADQFEFEYGLNERLRHVPSMQAERGEIAAFYAYARFKDGGHSFVVISRAEMEQIRSKHVKKNRQTGEIYGTWVDHFESMAKKTAIKQLVKYMPVSVEIRDQISRDDQGEQVEQEQEPFNVPDNE